MDVLIAPVGLQDPVSPKNQQPGSILAIAEKVRPRLVFLLPTRRPANAGGASPPEAETTIQAEHTRESLERMLAAPKVVVEIVPLDVQNPHLSEEIFPAIERAVYRIREECKLWGDGESLTFHVNAGSGTPAIKQAMTLLVSSGALVGEDGRARIYLVDDPKFTEEGADRVHEMDVSFIEELYLTPHTFELFDARQWLLAREHLARLSTLVSDVDRAAVAWTCAQILEVFAALDRLAYHQACTQLGQLRKTGRTRQASTRAPDLAALLDQYLQIATRLAQGDRPAILYDLLANAEHRLARHEYADALARCWHILEAALRDRFRKHHSIDFDADPPCIPSGSTDLAVDGQGRLRSQQYVSPMWKDLQSRGDAAIASLARRPVPAPLAADLNVRYQGMLNANDRLTAVLRRARRPGAAGPAIKNWSDLCGFLNDVRNHSLIAHGEHEVPKEVAQGAVALATEVLRACYAPAGAITDEPGLARFRACMDQGLRRL